MNVDDDAPEVILADMNGVDLGIDHAPLPRPVRTNALMAIDAPSFHAVRPIHVRMHGGENCIDVAVVERGVHRFHGYVVHDFLLWAACRSFAARLVDAAASTNLPLTH